VLLRIFRSCCKHALSGLRQRITSAIIVCVVLVAAATLAFATVIANHGRPPGDHYHLVTAKEQKNSSPSAQAVTTYKEDQLLYEAEQDLTRDCMRRAGFQYQVSSFTQSASVPSLQMLYFISSPGWAERNGFGNKAGASTVTQDPNASYVSRLPGQRQAAFSLALYGTTQGSPQVLVTIPQGDVVGHSMDGCQAQAEEELYGSFRIWFRVSSIADNIPLAVLGRVINTIRYKFALSHWAACIQHKNNSYSWSSPAAAAAAFRAIPQTRAVTRAETDAAVASAVCAATTDLLPSVRELNTQYTDTVMQRYLPDMEEYRRLQGQALSRAPTIIARDKQL
jgi:hypothetical protein